MSINLPPKWSRRANRWRSLLALALVAMLIHPLAGAQAQDFTIDELIIDNQATATYVTENGPAATLSNEVSVPLDLPLIDPGGQILGCDGRPLDTYTGFSMALFEPDESGLDLGNLLALTPTSDGDSIPPNISNLNPFFLSPTDGRYNFLLDSSKRLASGLAQTEPGAEFILVINPPEDSEFTERRIKIVITDLLNGPNVNVPAISYRATSLDGQPIAVDGSTELTKTVEIRDGAVQSLTFFEFGLDAAVCNAAQVSITKSADRSAAQPGDLVVYRLTVQNFAKAEIDSIIALDTLPVGFEFVPESVSGQIEDTPIEIGTEISGNTVSFSVQEAVTADQTVNITYATRLTPDAIRGSGRNSAIITARRTDSGYRIQDGPSTHQITLDPGILSDCGTLIGRVFEDKNFDGEQQRGEAGIPNAVIFLDDGNRVVTDADGLFSVQKMLPGQRVGTLDLASLPGYTLAPNLYFNERNSHSRLVNLAPGGLVRMNFGVTPTFQEQE